MAEDDVVDFEYDELAPSSNATTLKQNPGSGEGTRESVRPTLSMKTDYRAGEHNTRRPYSDDNRRKVSPPPRTRRDYSPPRQTDRRPERTHRDDRRPLHSPRRKSPRARSPSPRARSPSPSSRRPRTPPRKRVRSPSPPRRNQTRRRISNSPPRSNFVRTPPRQEFDGLREMDGGRVVTLPQNSERKSIREEQPTKIRMPFRDESPVARRIVERPTIRSEKLKGDITKDANTMDDSLRSVDHSRISPVYHKVKPTDMASFDLSSGSVDFARELLGNGSNRFFVARCNYYDMFVKTKRSNLWRAPEYVVDRIRKAAMTADKVLLFFSVHETNYFQEASSSAVDLALHVQPIDLFLNNSEDVPFYQVHQISGLFDRNGNVKESFEIAPDHSAKILVLFEKFARRMTEAFNGTSEEAEVETEEMELKEDEAKNATVNDIDGATRAVAESAIEDAAENTDVDPIASISGDANEGAQSLLNGELAPQGSESNGAEETNNGA